MAKTVNIAGDDSKEAKTVKDNNIKIIGMFAEIQALQKHSFAAMAKIRADEGPNGKPRIGG